MNDTNLDVPAITEEEWGMSDSQLYAFNIESPTYSVAFVPAGPNAERNAKLIKSAPALLAACEAGFNAMIETAEAIAEFTGRTDSLTEIGHYGKVTKQLKAAIAAATN